MCFWLGTLISYTYFPPYYLTQFSAKTAEAPTLQEIAHKEYIENPYDNRLYQLETTEGTKAYIQYLSDIYGLNEEFYQTIQCESNFLHEGVFGDGTRAYGILQFHEPTFKQFCKGDYHGLVDQLNCGAKMFAQGLQKHWSCWNRLIVLK